MRQRHPIAKILAQHCDGQVAGQHGDADHGGNIEQCPQVDIERGGGCLQQRIDPNQAGDAPANQFKNNSREKHQHTQRGGERHSLQRIFAFAACAVELPQRDRR